jgi:Uma2 family endonuclease
MNDFESASRLRYAGGVYMPADISRRRFTVGEYHRMAEVGILRPEERVELIRGEIIRMSPIGPRHAAAVDSANRAFGRLVGDDAIVRVQGTAILDEFAAPEPDLLLLRPRHDFYVRKHPAAPDILLLVEVADSSLEYDSTVKAELYAIVGIQEYWIADLRHDRLLTYSDPSGDAYHANREFRRGDSLAPILLPNCRLNTDVFFL